MPRLSSKLGSAVLLTNVMQHRIVLELVCGSSHKPRHFLVGEFSLSLLMRAIVARFLAGARVCYVRQWLRRLFLFLVRNLGDAPDGPDAWGTGECPNRGPGDRLRDKSTSEWPMRRFSRVDPVSPLNRHKSHHWQRRRQARRI